MAGVNVVGAQRLPSGVTTSIRTTLDTMPPPDEIDLELESMEPDIGTTGHMSFVDGRCACCPYGFHIDLDFLRYLDSLGKAGASPASLSNLRMIHQQKKKLRKSMEVYFRQQELSGGDPTGGVSRGREDEEARRLLSMVEREESVTSKVLDDFDSSINEQFSSRTSSSINNKKSGRQSVDDNQRYYSEAKVTLTRPPGAGGAQYLTTDYDSSSSVSISSGPPSPSLPYNTVHEMSQPASSHLEISRLSSGGSLTPSNRDPVSMTSSLKSDVRTTNGESVMRKMVTTTTTKSVTSAPDVPSSETVVLVDGTSVPPGMTLISAATLQTIREQMAACLQRLKELEEENKALNVLQVRMSVMKEEKKMLDLQFKAQQDLLAARSAREKQNEQELMAARSAIQKLKEEKLRSVVEKRTVGVGDCTLNDSFMPDNERLLHRSANGDFSSDIQVIRKINLESMAPPRGAPPPVAKKPCRSIGVGDGNVFVAEVIPASVALTTTVAPIEETPPVVRVHEKELSTEQKTEIHEKEVKMVFLERSAESSLFGDKSQIAPKPKPLTHSIGVGNGNVFDSNNSDSDSFQLHEKELRTVFIGGDSNDQKERKVTRNVGILCKAAMRDVGVMYHMEDSTPMTRNIAVGVGEIGFDGQGVSDSSEYGERSDTSIHVTNTALQQLNMAAFQSRHLRITNEQLQQVLDSMLKKNLRSVGVQCRFATVDRAVSATGNGDGTGVNQVTVGCSDDTVDVDIVPVRQWRSIGVDNRPSVFHRASGADVVYRVDSSTNTQTQGIRLERATNTENVTRYPAATNTEAVLPGESVSTETESNIFHGISALCDVMTNTEELYYSSVTLEIPENVTRVAQSLAECHHDSVSAATKESSAMSSQSATAILCDSVPAPMQNMETLSSQSATAILCDSVPAPMQNMVTLSSQSATAFHQDRVPAGLKGIATTSSQSVTLRPGVKARSTDYRTSRDLLTLGILPCESEERVSSSVTSLSSSIPPSEHSSSILNTSLPTMATSSVHDTSDPNCSSNLTQVSLTSRTFSVPIVAGSSETTASSNTLNSSMASCDSMSTSDRSDRSDRLMDESSDGSVDTLCSVVWRGDASDSPVSRHRVWSTHTTVSRGANTAKSAPTDIDLLPHGSHRLTDMDLLPHGSHRLVSLDQDRNILSEQTSQSTTVEPATSIRVFETITEVRRTGPEGSTGYVTSSVSDGHVTTTRDIDGSLRSIMKSSSSSPIARRRKEISFVDNILVSTDSGSMGDVGDVDVGGVSGSDDSRRSSASYEEGTYDGRHGNVVYSCKDDSSTTTRMFDQHFRETYEMSPEMLSSCVKYAQWLDDSTGVTAKELNASLAVVQQEWFNVSSHKLTNPSQVDDYMTSINGISRNLLEHIVNMADANGNSALHYAVSHGNFEVVGLLLETQVVDINLPNRAGYTAIMLASLADVQTDRQREIVQRLFHSGNVNLRAAQAGQTALMLAVSHGKIDLAQMLINAGADVNIQDEDGSTALMCASEHGHIDIVKLLLAQTTCDVTLTDNDESTAMSIAMEAGHRDIGVLLYAHVNFRPGSPKLKKKTGSRGSVSPTKK